MYNKHTTRDVVVWQGENYDEFNATISHMTLQE